MPQVTYQIDPAHSSAQFSIRHMMIANVRGEFSKVSGTVAYDPANPANASVDARIEAASISTRDTQRDAHLRSPDFFDAEKFPLITFRSKQAGGQDGEWKVRGDLTICQYRLKIPHCAGRKFPSPHEVVLGFVLG